MPTIKQPQGRMTKPLVTTYAVGDRVRFVYYRGGANAIEAEIAEGESMPRLGDVGTVRRITIADPNDGDQTFLMIDVRWDALGTRWPVAESEIQPRFGVPWAGAKLGVSEVTA